MRVSIKIEEKGKTRLQAFEGLVIAVKHGKESGGTFTVRKVASGVGVEKIFPIYSPAIDKIEILRRSKVRRSKLYYIREKVAREISRKMRTMRALGKAPEEEEEIVPAETEETEVTKETEETPSAPETEETVEEQKVTPEEKAEATVA